MLQPHNGPYPQVCSYCGERNYRLAVTCSLRCTNALRRMKAKQPGSKLKVPKRTPPPLVSMAKREAIIDAAGNKCELCGSPPGARRLHIDHDHTTGALRGLLCHGCNVGLGYFKDDPELLERAAEYLRKPR